MSKGEVQYFLMFAMGIAAFWVSGFVAGMLPAMHGVMAMIAGLAATLAVYGLSFGVLELVLLGRERSLKAVGIATAVVAMLALAAAQLLTKIAAGHIHNQLDLGFLTFALYLFYGFFYVIGNTIARRLAK